MIFTKVGNTITIDLEEGDEMYKSNVYKKCSVCNRKTKPKDFFLREGDSYKNNIMFEKLTAILNINKEGVCRGCLVTLGNSISEHIEKKIENKPTVFHECSPDSGDYDIDCYPIGQRATIKRIFSTYGVECIFMIEDNIIDEEIRFLRGLSYCFEDYEDEKYNAQKENILRNEYSKQFSYWEDVVISSDIDINIIASNFLLKTIKKAKGN